jgi:hypothetical protein
MDPLVNAGPREAGQQIGLAREDVRWLIVSGQRSGSSVGSYPKT